MATINVERFRKNTDADSDKNGIYPDRTDADTIQKAVDSLKDGDTLVFNKKVETYDNDGNLTYDTTYVLDKPIHLTSYKRHVDSEGNVTETGKTRRRITFDGNGCTIKSSSEFSNYFAPHVRTVHKKIDGEDVFEDVTVNIDLDALFVTSDIMDNYVSDSHFKNFIFKSVAMANNSPTENPDEEENDDKKYHTAISEGPTNPGNYWTYHYLQNSKISNCEFYYFYNGINIGGMTNTIEVCRFEGCTNGIFCDCPNQVYIHHNYLIATEKYGITLHKSYRAFVCNNHFHHCIGCYIAAAGTYAEENDGKTMSISICSNTLVGGDISGNTRNQTGILLNGIKSAIVKDNFIYNMKSLVPPESANKYTEYGIGIFLNGNNNADLGYRFNDRCIVSGNEIYGCMICGIKVNHSAACTVSGNSVHNGTSGDGDGIYIGDRAGDLHVADNALFYFEEGKFMRLPDTNINAENNTYYNKNGKFDPLSPKRYIRTHVSYMDPSTICIPKLSVPLDTGDEFEMLVPHDYSASIVTSITYEGLTGTVYNSGLPYLVPSTKAGTYIKLRYTYGQSANSGEKYIRFTVVE